MHPIERLRYVARASHVPGGALAQETAMALANFVGDDAGMQIACQRILSRQPTVAPLVWLTAHTLSAPNQRTALWDAVEQLEEDQTLAALAYELPDNAIVATVGWTDAAATLIRKRGDVGFVVIDTDGSAEYQIDRVTDDPQHVNIVDAESTAQALVEATHMLVSFAALGAEHGLAPMGSFAAAAVAKHLEIAVWGTAELGVALADRMYDGLTRRWHEQSDDPLTLRDVEEVPLSLIDKVATTNGLVTPADAVRNSGCPIVPELF